MAVKAPDRFLRQKVIAMKQGLDEQAEAIASLEYVKTRYLSESTDFLPLKGRGRAQTSLYRRDRFVRVYGLSDLEDQLNSLQQITDPKDKTKLRARIYNGFQDSLSQDYIYDRGDQPGELSGGAS